MECYGICLNGSNCTQKMYLKSINGKLWCHHHREQGEAYTPEFDNKKKKPIDQRQLLNKLLNT